MKTIKTFLNLLLFALILGACSEVKNNHEFILNGEITGDLKDSIILYYNNDSGKMINVGASLAEGGEFTLKGEINDFSMGYLVMKNKGEQAYDGSNQSSVILEPGKIKFTAKGGDFMNAVIKGGKYQDDFNELNALKNPVMAKLIAIYDSAKKETDPEKAEVIKELAEPYRAQIEEIDLAFFDKNPTSLATAFGLRMYVSSLDVDKLTNYYEKLDQKIKENTLGKELYKEIENLKAGSPGSVAADFTGTGLDGETFNLSDFKGKYVILDFWASWCVPCRQSFPHMIKLYNTYKDKGLEVICISDDDRNHDAWRTAIEKDNISMWHHTLRGLDMDKRMRNEENENDISDKFGIHSLPTKLLIDPEGLIIGRYVGNDEEDNSLDSKLKEVFGVN